MRRLVDEVAVAQFIAFKNEAVTAAEKATRKKLRGQKDALIDALHFSVKCALPPLDSDRIPSL